MKVITGFAAGLLMIVLAGVPSVSLADTITAISLEGGNGGAVNWTWNGHGWDTTNQSWCVLGVTSTPNGPLENQSNKSISVLFDNDYWLHAWISPLGLAGLGDTPKLKVTTTEKGMLTTFFTISGSPGSESDWSFLAGSPLLQLGWASGSADKVGFLYNTNMNPDGASDFYLHLQAGNPQGSSVPEPSTLLLLGSGLVGLAGMRRRFKVKG